MEYPGGKKQHFRHLLFFAYHRGQKAAEAARNICNVYGEGVIGDSTARKWFAKFRYGDFSFHGDSPRSGRLREIDNKQIKCLMENNPRYIIWEVAQELQVNSNSLQNSLNGQNFESEGTIKRNL
ncbi:Histone-lysine N-methyltransferase SETMAR [Anthophora retusa]